MSMVLQQGKTGSQLKTEHQISEEDAKRYLKSVETPDYYWACMPIDEVQQLCAYIEKHPNLDSTTNEKSMLIYFNKRGEKGYGSLILAAYNPFKKSEMRDSGTDDDVQFLDHTNLNPDQR